MLDWLNVAAAGKVFRISSIRYYLYRYYFVFELPERLHLKLIPVPVA